MGAFFSQNRCWLRKSRFSKNHAPAYTGAIFSRFAVPQNPTKYGKNSLLNMLNFLTSLVFAFRNEFLAPKCVERLPRGSQGPPRGSSLAPKEPPRDPQGASKGPPRGTQGPPRAPKSPQGTPKGPPGAPKRAPRAPKGPPRGPQRGSVE